MQKFALNRLRVLVCNSQHAHIWPCRGNLFAWITVMKSRDVDRGFRGWAKPFYAIYAALWLRCGHARPSSYIQTFYSLLANTFVNHSSPTHINFDNLHQAFSQVAHEKAIFHFINLLWVNAQCFHETNHTFTKLNIYGKLTMLKTVIQWSKAKQTGKCKLAYRIASWRMPAAHP